MSETSVTAPEAIEINAGGARLHGDLGVPGGARSLVVFAHGSGSSRHSPRNQAVASFLRERGMATLLFDLLTEDEDEIDRITRELRFDIELLAGRLAATTAWCRGQSELAELRIGYFGASTGAAAALVAAAREPEPVGAVVSRGGRPDLAGPALGRVAAPTLLIVGGNDTTVIRLNEAALQELDAEKELKIVPGATHLFEEPGALEQVAELAAAWFEQHLSSES
jgi:dienelactone hydrolase